MTGPRYAGKRSRWPRLPGVRGYAVPGLTDAFVRTAISQPGLPIAEPVQGYARLGGNVIWQAPARRDASGHKVVDFAVRFGVARTDIPVWLIESMTANGRLIYGQPDLGNTEILAVGEVENGEPVDFDVDMYAFWPPRTYLRHPEATISIHYGPEPPDGLLLADKGAANVPADFGAGKIIVYFGDFPLAEYGDQIPAIVAFGGPADNASQPYTAVRREEFHQPGGTAEGIGAPAILMRDRLHAVGPSNLQRDPDTSAVLPPRSKVGVQEWAVLQTRQMHEWMPPGVVQQGVEQAAAIGAVPGPVTYWASSLLWPEGWSMALDDRDEAYFVEVLEGEAWQEPGWRGPLLDDAGLPVCNRGRWEKSRTKFRVVRADPWSGGRLAASSLFRSPTTGEEYWWRPIPGCTEVAAPSQGRSALRVVQMMASGDWLYVLFVAYPKQPSGKHTYWRAPQVDLQTPPPFTGPTGPYTDPGTLSHAPGIGRTDIRGAVVTFRLPLEDDAAPAAVLDLGGQGMIPAGLWRGPDGTVFVAGGTATRRRWVPLDPEPSRSAVIAWLDGTYRRSVTPLAAVPVSDEALYDGILPPPTPPSPGDPLYSSVALLLHLDGANNQTTTVDSGPANRPITWASPGSGSKLETAEKKFGTASLRLVRSFFGHIRAADNVVFFFGSGDFTIEAFVKLATVPAGDAEADRYAVASHWDESTGQRSWRLTVSSTTVRFSGYNSLNAAFAEVSGAWTPNTTAWRHLAACRSGTDVRLFLDGVQIGIQTWTGQIRDATVAVRIGLGNEVFPQPEMPFNGWIDEVRITRAARYTANFAVPTDAFPNQGVTEPEPHPNDYDQSAALIPMSGLHDAATAAVYVFGNGQLMHPTAYQLAYPRQPQLTGTVYKVTWPGAEVAGTVAGVPPGQYSQLHAGPTDGKVRVRGHHNLWQQSSDGSYHSAAPVSPTALYHRIRLADLALETDDLGYAVLGEANRRLAGDANDFLYEPRTRTYVFLK